MRVLEKHSKVRQHLQRPRLRIDLAVDAIYVLPPDLHSAASNVEYSGRYTISKGIELFQIGNLSFILGGREHPYPIGDFAV